MSLDWRVARVHGSRGDRHGSALRHASRRCAPRACNPNDAMKEQGRGVAGRTASRSATCSSSSRSRCRWCCSWRRGLVRAHVRLARQPRPRLRPRARCWSPASTRSRCSSSRTRVATCLRRLREAAATTPGVSSAALSAVTPVSGSTWNNRLELPRRQPIEAADKGTFINLVSPDWFRTYGTRLLGGRDFTAADRLGAPDVVDRQRGVRAQVHGRGKSDRPPRTRARVRAARRREREIVGYVADAVYRSLREPVPPTMYYRSRRPRPRRRPSSISVRAAAGSPALLTRAWPRP